MKKSITLLFTVFLSLTAICAQSTLYLNTGGSNLWNQADAKFQAHVWNSSANGWSSVFTLVPGETDIYQATLPEGEWTDIIVLRKNPNNFDDNVNLFTGEWNRIQATITGEGNCITISGWNESDYAWSTYTPSNVSLDAPRSSFVNEVLTLSASSTDIANPVYSYSALLPGQSIFTPITLPYTPTTTGTYIIKVDVAESGDPTVIASSEKSVFIKEIPANITIKVEVPEEWNSGIISFFYWNADNPSGSFVTATLSGGKYEYEFSRIDTLNFVVVNGTTWNGDANQTQDVEEILSSSCFTVSAEGEGKKTITAIACSPATGLTETAIKYSLYVENKTIRAIFRDKAQIDLFTACGQRIYSGIVNDGFSYSTNDPGLYLLRINGQTSKIIVQ